jgi:DNA-binding MarR family transcriptional regulator
MSDMTLEGKPVEESRGDGATMRERYADQLPEHFPEPTPIPVLVREIFQLSQRFERHLGAALTVNMTDLQAMEHLMEGGPMTPSRLASRLAMSTAATTHVIDRLVAAGHVERRPHPDDRRKVTVTPTPASIARAFEELAPMISGVTSVADSYSSEDRAVIESFLRGVASVYRGIVGEEVTPARRDL